MRQLRPKRQRPPRRRWATFLAALAVILLGLGSRRFPHLVPELLSKYPGDALWALMVFFGWGFILPSASSVRVGALALGTSFLIEASQAARADWLIEVRSTTLGHLVLGSDFHWGDFVAYAVGVAIGVFIEGVGVAVASGRPSEPSPSEPSRH